LFDARIARNWIDAFDARTEKPFRVALPDYGARVIEADDGRVIAIESEMPKLAGGDRTLDLMARPSDVADLLDDLSRNLPRHFAGIVWFRLPTADDSLTWSLATWRAVIMGKSLRADVQVVARPTPTSDLSNIVLVNRGDVDSMLPAAIGLPDDCRLADGVNGYALDTGGGKIILRRLQTALLRAHREQIIGWARCNSSRGTFDVRP
jgi:hypothetical protein